MKQRKETTTKNKKVVTFMTWVCDSLYLFSMRSVNSNVK